MENNRKSLLLGGNRVKQISLFETKLQMNHAILPFKWFTLFLRWYLILAK